MIAFSFLKCPSACFRALTAAVAGLLVLPAAAQEAKHPAKPFLWKIEGKALKKPSYLFGTIHASSAAIETLHPAAEEAFKSSDVLYTEISMTKGDQMEVIPLMMRKDGKTLAESIGPDLSAKLDAELKAIQPELDSTPFQTFKTWAVMATLPLLKSQLQGRKAIDALLWEQAEASGKETGALETAAGQIGVFGQFPEADTIVMLAETLKQAKEDRESGVDSIDKLLNAYATGDVRILKDELDKSQRRAAGEAKEITARFLKALMTDRDVTMADTIDEKLAAAPDRILFFAVGAGHLIGEKNIRDHLAAKGYRVTRVQD